MQATEKTLDILMIEGYRLTTAEILYHFPDHPLLLQSFVWQEYDLAPKFPKLTKFLDFWEANLDGKVHSVKMAAKELVTGNEMRFAAAQLYLH